MKVEFNSDCIKFSPSPENLQNSILFFDNGRQSKFSWADFWRRVESLSHHFILNGIKHNEYIPVFAHNDIYSILSVLALWKIKSIPVLINPSLTLVETEKIFNQFSFKKIVTTSLVSETNKNYEDYFIFSDNSQTENMNMGAFSEIEFSYKDDAIVIFTSGSSSTPKGVVHKFHSLVKSFLIGKDFFNYSSDDRWLLSLPIYHIGGFSIFFRALLSNAQIVIPPSLSYDDLIEQIEKYEPNFFSFVSAQFKKIIESNIQAPKDNRVLLGGGRIDSNLIEEGIKKGWNIYKVYGSSETAAFVTILTPDNFNNYPTSAGKALTNISITIENKDENNIGEIVINSPTLFDRYINQLPHKKNLFNTEDFGYLKDDFLFIENRRTNLIVSAGKNINPQEIEDVLMKSELVNEVVVLGIEDIAWGEKVIAVVVPKGNESNIENRLRTFSKKYLSSYKIPKMFLLVKDIPKTSLGKIKYEELKDLIISLH
ncbi:MAG TPA: class I adenylate-forming enzyme family protein [Ignavibacteriaceae bacterium]|nr:class I adenylate-forming enzyme family protein [Ignavibacteriaceae bacterium]